MNQELVDALWKSISSVYPSLILFIVGMIVLIWGLGSGTATSRWLPGLSFLGLLVSAAAGVSMLGIHMMEPDAIPETYFGGGIVADNFAGYVCIILAIAGMLTIGMSGRYLEEKRIKNGEFYALLLFSISGAMLMAQSFDLVNIFIGLEVLSVALYILAGFARRELRSEEAAVKYFLLGAFASGFLLFGTSLVYGAVGLTAKANGIIADGFSYTNFVVMGQVLRESAHSVYPLATSPIFVVGIALIVVGLGFKAAIVPFHSYAPDVYEGSPTPVTAFMSAGAKIGAFAAFVRLFHLLLNDQSSEIFRVTLWVLALATMLVGNVMAVRQTNIKRMLAYSSIAHAGYILTGVLAEGIRSGMFFGSQAVVYYLFVYTLMNLGAFAVVIWLGRDGGEYTQIKDYAGLAKTNPLAAAVMMVFMLSLAGIPPTAGFVGKLYLFTAAAQANQWLLVAVGLVVSAIGVFYYLNIIIQMYLREPEHGFEGARGRGAQLTAILAAVATVVLGVVPNLVVPPRPQTVGAPTLPVATAPAARSGEAPVEPSAPTNP